MKMSFAIINWLEKNDEKNGWAWEYAALSKWYYATSIKIWRNHITDLLESTKFGITLKNANKTQSKEKKKPFWKKKNKTRMVLTNFIRKENLKLPRWHNNISKKVWRQPQKTNKWIENVLIFVLFAATFRYFIESILKQQSTVFRLKFSDYFHLFATNKTKRETLSICE